MILGMVCCWETMGKKTKIIPRVDLCYGQRDSSAMMNIMKGDLPSMILNITKTGF